jgi:hypothetical protein
MAARTTLALTLASLAAVAGAQDSRPASRAQSGPESRPGSRAVMQAVIAELREKGVELDPDAQTVTIDATFQVTEDYLEYFLIGRRGKSHEALLRTQVKASVLNAALIALGYSGGTNVDYKEKVPMPTEEEFLAGAPMVDVIRPKGMEVHITVEWRDADGKRVRRRAEELWIDTRDEQPPRDAKWIYFGGQMAPLLRNEPPVFVADFEENFVSLCHMKPDNHLVTVDHDEAGDDKVWWPNQKLVPQRGTEARIIFSRKPIS